MSPDSDLISLYSTRILALATDITNTTPLANPGIRVKKRAPLCGSTISIELSVENGKITGYCQDVKACALGQAAASVVGANILDCSKEQVQTARDQLLAMLKSDGPGPDAPFDELKVLLPAREYKNRHASILLSLDASMAALEHLS